MNRHDDWREREEPKSDFVPFATRVRRERPYGHDMFYAGTLTGALRYRLEVLRPVHIGWCAPLRSEDAGLGGKLVVKATARVRGRPVIPGTSQKGAFRAIFEAVTESCLSVTRITRGVPNQWELRPCSSTMVCPACSLFGTQGRMGKVAFEDARLDEGYSTVLTQMAHLYRPRLGPGRAPAHYLGPDRRTLKGRKFYVHGSVQQGGRTHRIEAIAPGSTLTGRVRFANVTPGELGALFFAMGLDGSFVPKLGAGKPRDFGAIIVHPVELVIRDSRQAFLSAGDSGETTTDGAAAKRVLGLIGEARRSKLILASQAEALARILARRDEP